MTSAWLIEGKSLRITGGEARGRLIAGPQGLPLRPTASKVRQAIFNILAFKLNQARFLDLCAGTGLMGLEALSRGAASLIAVEEDRRAIKAIDTNLKHLGYEAELICADVRKALVVLESAGFDIIFADPPYKTTLAREILSLVNEKGLLDLEGVLVIEHLKNIQLPEREGELERSSYRCYGQTALSIYENKR